MVTVTKDKIATLLWNTFYDKIVAEVTTLEIEGTDVTIQTYASAYNDKMLNSKSNYPIIIINFPERKEENITFTDVEADCEITIEITANSAIVADTFFDKISDAISEAEDEFNGYGIDELMVTSTSDQPGKRGKIKIHNREQTWGFKYVYTR